MVAITDNDRVGNVGNQANERPMITDNVGNVDIKSRDRGKNMLRLLDIFTEYPHFSIAEAANMLGIVKRTAERYASQLQKEGLLVRHGVTRNVRWEVISPNGSISEKKSSR